jgi:molybdopterin-guanine dinucleotide biosynthesis protein A
MWDTIERFCETFILRAGKNRVDVAGIVLIGGKSTRMGVSKPMLPFGPELMIQRVLRLLSQAASPLVVVAAPDQVLPGLPRSVQVVRDRREGRGPLEGIRAGLEALEGRREAAYVAGCDVPTLQAAFVCMLADRLAQHRIAVPVDGGHYHPLAAAYRVDVLPEVRALLAADRLRPAYLFQQVDTCCVPVDQLRSVDPELSSLENLNRPEDYFAALQRCGFEVSEGLRQSIARANGTPLGECAPADPRSNGGR